MAVPEYDRTRYAFASPRICLRKDSATSEFLVRQGKDFVCSADSIMEPFSAGAVFASIGSAFKFAELAVRLTEVGSENEVFMRTVHVVREDLEEVNRLLSIESFRRKLASIPGKSSWIRGAVATTKNAMNDIGKAIEWVRVEKEATGSVKFETRVRWVFSDHEKIMCRTSGLSICHQQPSNVVSYLAGLEDTPFIVDPPACPDVTYLNDIITRHQGRTALRPADMSRLARVNACIAFTFTFLLSHNKLMNMPRTATSHRSSRDCALRTYL
jgi:hypothetical protein